MTLLSVLFALLLQPTITVTASAPMGIAPVVHVDSWSSVAAEYGPSVEPLAPICGAHPYPIQWVWRVAQMEKTVDTGRVEERLLAVTQQVNGLFYAASNRPDEYRLPAWKMTADCRLDIWYIGPTDPPPLRRGHKLIIVESTQAYCGIALLYPDPDPTAENMNNRETLAWVARGCLTPHIVTHELLHMFGAVQESAPHFVSGFHVNDHRDVMQAAPEGVPLCLSYDTIDCGQDDYWSLAPAPDSYLATHWNSANNVFLLRLPRHRVWAPLMFFTEGTIPPWIWGK